MESETVSMPQQLICFISRKLEQHGNGGRPNFLQRLTKDHRILTNELLNILELVWIENRSLGRIARKYGTSYHTIYRLLHDLDPLKEILIAYLQTIPRRKNFYNSELDQSDYESIRRYIKRARRTSLKHYKENIKIARKCWAFLKHKDPENWTAENVLDFLATLTEGSQSRYLDCIRQIAPQIADKDSTEYIGTGQFREKLRLRKKNLFGHEVNMIHKALDAYGLVYEKDILDLHITTGAREGSTNPESGICGVSWDRFKNNFKTVDLYESKVRGGIWCRDCPLDIFFKALPERLKKLWIERGKPTTDKLLEGGYRELRDIYRQIRWALKEHYAGKLDPALFQELTTLKPHDSDKIHCNLLWEAKIPIEVVAGEYLGRGEGVGLMGRIWLDINTIKKHYLSLNKRSERMKELRAQVREYSNQFNGDLGAIGKINGFEHVLRAQRPQQITPLCVS